MAIVSLDSLLCEVPCLILHSVVYRDVTRQAKGLHCLKYVGALERGLAHLSQCNSGWFCHSWYQSSQVYSGDMIHLRNVFSIKFDQQTYLVKLSWFR
jgi:hypothetical protein